MGLLAHVGLACLVLTLVSIGCEAGKGEKDHKLKNFHGLGKHNNKAEKEGKLKKDYYGLTKHNQAEKETSRNFPEKPHHHGLRLRDKSEKQKNIELFDSSSKHRIYKEKKSKLMKKHKGKKHGNKALNWMEFRPESECKPRCERNEVCIAGPIDGNTMCVKRKSLKKSIKLFHRYQKKEMKQWKKFKKQHYNDVYDEEKHWKMENKNHDDGKMKEHHLKKHDHDYMMEKKAKKHLNKPHKPAFVDDENECPTHDFGEMRTRMMGWFHVLHGQDHLMKKQKKGSLKHFHKHVSVKKELREHEGESCQCFKSAMWQFHEMDETKDNVLDHKELKMVEDNTLEPCVKPYLASCDKDADGVLSEDEWCCCFSSVVAPCFKKLDEIRQSGDKLEYVPRCDKEGYYMREQCQRDNCWCVDYNGNEYKGTFTKGRAHCSKIALRGLEQTPMV